MRINEILNSTNPLELRYSVVLLKMTTETQSTHRFISNVLFLRVEIQHFLFKIQH